MKVFVRKNFSLWILKTCNYEILVLRDCLTPHDSEAPDRRLLQSEKIAMVRRAIAQLRNIDKEMIELFYNRKLSLLEIQRMLDIPMGTVKRRLFTARHRAKELLERLDAA